MSIKVLHITAGTVNGGAGKGAYWLHQELRRQGIDSRMLVQVGKEDEGEGISVISDTRLNRLRRLVYTHFDALPTRFYFKRAKHLFSTGMSGFDVTRVRNYEWADIIHFHWINQGLVKIRDIRKIKKPIVWTMRDMWPMTGGCHHSFDCDKYTSGCGACQHLGSNQSKDLSANTIRRKQESYIGDIHPVAISSWLRECAERSLVMANMNVEVIHNGIDTRIFYPVEKEKARRELGIPIGTKTVLIGANSPKEIYKGYDKFVASLQFQKQEYFYIFFGAISDSDLRPLNIRFLNFGSVCSIQKLVSIYSAADVFVAPSVAEAFGKTLVEALSCGTPVVAFDATGPKDIVQHQINGYSAKPFDPRDLADGINWVLDQEDRLKQLSSNARRIAEHKFDIALIASRYHRLYERILMDRHHGH